MKKSRIKFNTFNTFNNVYIGLNGLNGSFFGEFLKTTDNAKDTKTFGTGKRFVKSAQKMDA